MYIVRFIFQVMNFSEQAVASYIAFVGILSVLAQVRDQHSLVILKEEFSPFCVDMKVMS